MLGRSATIHARDYFLLPCAHDADGAGRVKCEICELCKKCLDIRFCFCIVTRMAKKTTAKKPTYYRLVVPVTEQEFKNIEKIAAEKGHKNAHRWAAAIIAPAIRGIYVR